MYKLFLYLLINAVIIGVTSFVASQYIFSLSIDMVGETKKFLMGMFLAFLFVLSEPARIILSLTTLLILFNDFKYIRDKKWLSFLSFCGFSLGFLLYFSIVFFKDSLSAGEALMRLYKPFLLMLSTHFLLMFLSFLIFQNAKNRLEKVK